MSRDVSRGVTGAPDSSLNYFDKLCAMDVRERILRQLKSQFQFAGVFDGSQLQIDLVNRTERREVLDTNRHTDRHTQLTQH